MTKILLIDDDERVRKTLRIHIKKAGYDLQTANDGLEGWERYQQESFDVILCDMSMPKMNGVELIQKIRERDASIPIIMLSGFMESSVAEEAMSSGANEYLTKPIQKNDLLAAIQTHLK